MASAFWKCLKLFLVTGFPAWPVIMLTGLSALPFFRMMWVFITKYILCSPALSIAQSVWLMAYSAIICCLNMALWWCLCDLWYASSPMRLSCCVMWCVSYSLRIIRCLCFVLWHYLLLSLVPHAWYVYAACHSIIPITPSSRIYFGYFTCPNKTLLHNDLCTGYIKLPVHVRIVHAGNIKCASLVNTGLMRTAFSFIAVHYSMSTITQEY